MINDTMHSLHTFINGLPLDTPIFISVDGIPSEEKTAEKEQRLVQYTDNLRKEKFHPFTNVQVFPMPGHFHIAGSVNHTLALYAKTEFVYVLQHDLSFCQPIDHPRLIKAMRDNPKTLFNVRFRLKTRQEH
eukprot:TRINITY_DN56347_c0_g1_i1.p1 TRINITY_DN56347_c0_g1~~TRINITY_DN56347_c0_g1_i1.p1  ORF type:complete len:131 (+),score=6.27 TRINITY_DN56347_c0_g1_i1:251-643(+)